MKESIQALREYLVDVGAEHVRLAVDQKASRRLPVYLGSAYEIYDANLFGKPYHLLHRKKGETPAPADLAKHALKAERILGRPIVFLLNSVQSFDRQRLIRKGVAFIVPHHQVYLPMALVDLRKQSSGSQVAHSDDSSKLSIPAQMLLVYYLQHPAVNELSLNDWAERLRYSPSSMTRVRRDLERLGLCDVRGAGKARRLKFDDNRHAVWDRALPYLRSPVKSRGYCRIMEDSGLPFLLAGLSALAGRSMLSADSTSSYAMSVSAFKAAVEHRKLDIYSRGELDSVEVEQWSYAPAVTSRGMRQVDDLSLFLSMRDSPDERVQAALQEMMENMPW
jgi:hypothetical protein